MAKVKITGSTIPYQLRPRKAIERNLFIDLLKKLDACSIVNFKDYRYVGFGAAYLEDFKQMHMELNVTKMHCIEMDENAFTRQKFNNPYYFIRSFNKPSTEYIDEDLKFNRNQIIWLDYAMPRHLRQQLLDIELLCSKLSSLDVIKFTFNSKIGSFISSHQVRKEGRYCMENDFKTILSYLRGDATYNNYLSEDIEVRHFVNFDLVIRSMAIRAINRGLANGNKGFKFYHLASFSYADGQDMTTITGIICNNDYEFEIISEESKLINWPFYNGRLYSEFIDAIEIAVPDMTVSERFEIDKKIPADDVDAIANSLPFYYGSSMDEHIYLINGYHTFYKYLPYYSKVIY